MSAFFCPKLGGLTPADGPSCHQRKPQEVREWLEDHKKLMQKLRLKRLNPKSAFKSTIKKRAMDKR